MLPSHSVDIPLIGCQREWEKENIQKSMGEIKYVHSTLIHTLNMAEHRAFYSYSWQLKFKDEIIKTRRKKHI